VRKEAVHLYGSHETKPSNQLLLPPKILDRIQLGNHPVLEPCYVPFEIYF
jgi:hypothetical protein